MPDWHRDLAAFAPAQSGVYALFDGQETVFIGTAREQAGGVRACLIEHFGDECASDQDLDLRFRYQIVDDESAEHIARRWLEVFEGVYGRSPRMNRSSRWVGRTAARATRPHSLARDHRRHRRD